VVITGSEDGAQAVLAGIMEVLTFMNFTLPPTCERTGGPGTARAWPRRYRNHSPCRESDDDEWPEIADKLRKADIVIFATPIWWGQRSSLIQRVIERKPRPTGIRLSGLALVDNLRSSTLSVVVVVLQDLSSDE
jgi:hypothetical protein